MEEWDHATCGCGSLKLASAVDVVSASQAWLLHLHDSVASFKLLKQHAVKGKVVGRGVQREALTLMKVHSTIRRFKSAAHLVTMGGLQGWVLWLST